jgi:hypothetical protein
MYLFINSMIVGCHYMEATLSTLKTTLKQVIRSSR